MNGRLTRPQRKAMDALRRGEKLYAPRSDHFAYGPRTIHRLTATVLINRGLAEVRTDERGTPYYAATPALLEASTTPLP